jgi:7-cyano-7-deazaguanine synthase in queuosine biosynthesis
LKGVSCSAAAPAQLALVAEQAMSAEKRRTAKKSSAAATSRRWTPRPNIVVALFAAAYASWCGLTQMVGS